MKLKLSLKGKTVFAILALALVLTITAISISYTAYAEAMNEYYEKVTLNVAKTAAITLNAEDVASYTTAVTDIYSANPAPIFNNTQEEAAYYAQYDVLKDDLYYELSKTLTDLKGVNRVESLYLGYVDTISNTALYVLDPDVNEDACAIGSWDVIYDALPTLGPVIPAYITNTEEFGWLCSAGAAILDDDGNIIAYAMVDISMNDVMAERHAFLMQLCFILLLVTIILICLFIQGVNLAVVKPINLLATATSSYSSGENITDIDKVSSALEKISINTGDEVENLCTSIKQMAKDINVYIENLTIVTAEKEYIAAELGVAAHIQVSMLPCIFPAFPQRDEFDIYATMIPAKEVGGDFYDFFLVDNDHLAVVIADVSGKGVPAALFMVIAKTLIKDHTQAGNSPDMVFTEVNQQLCEANNEGLFVTAWMGVLEISTGNLIFVNAGHNPPYIYDSTNSWHPIQMRPGFVLAGLDSIKYKTGSAHLASGDCLYLFTDGITEATDVDNMLYGDARLESLLNRQENHTPQHIIDVVKEDIDIFVGEAPQFDDITMLCLKIT